MCASYKKGDVEIHTFIFENNSIDAYINKAVTNFYHSKLYLNILKNNILKLIVV